MTKEKNVFKQVMGTSVALGVGTNVLGTIGAPTAAMNVLAPLPVLQASKGLLGQVNKMSKKMV